MKTQWQRPEIGSYIKSLDLPISDAYIHDMSIRLSEPHRHYHNWSHHVGPMVQRAAEAGEREILIAALFHDIVYTIGSDHNEEDSFEYFHRVYENSDAKLEATIRALILATKPENYARLDDPQAIRFVIDYDLADLASYDKTVENFHLIRKEYADVPLPDFKKGNRAVYGLVEAFLKKHNRQDMVENLKRLDKYVQAYKES